MGLGRSRRRRKQRHSGLRRAPSNVQLGRHKGVRFGEVATARSDLSATTPRPARSSILLGSPGGPARATHLPTGPEESSLFQVFLGASRTVSFQSALPFQSGFQFLSWPQEGECRDRAATTPSLWTEPRQVYCLGLQLPASPTGPSMCSPGDSGCCSPTKFIPQSFCTGFPCLEIYTETCLAGTETDVLLQSNDRDSSRKGRINKDMEGSRSG